MDIQEIIKQRNLTLIETGILVHLYKKHPDMLRVQDLLENESQFNEYKYTCNVLVRKGLVVKDGNRYGIVWG